MEAPTASVLAGQAIRERPASGSVTTTLLSGKVPVFDTLKLYVTTVPVPEKLLMLADFTNEIPAAGQVPAAMVMVWA